MQHAVENLVDAGSKDEGLQVEGPKYPTNRVSSMDNHHFGIWPPLGDMWT